MVQYTVHPLTKLSHTSTTEILPGNVQSSNQGLSVEHSPMDLLTLEMDPHQVHKSQVALLALPYYILGSSQYSTAQVALALPWSISHSTRIHRGVWCRTWTPWCWSTHLPSSGTQDSVLNLLTLVTEIFLRSQQLLLASAPHP